MKSKFKSKIRFLIHNKRLFRSAWYFLNRKKYNKVDEKTKNKKGRLLLNYKFDCTKPRTFNEYTTWLLLNYRDEQWKICADKLKSKQFLINHGFGKYVIDVLRVYDSSSQIDLNELPNKFVLKTNHDSGSVYICEKGKTNFKEVFAKLDYALKEKYSTKHGEWVYEDIEPKIFAEKFIQPKRGELLVDYKIFSFNGCFGWGFTGQERDTDPRFCVFDENFNIQDVEYIYLRPNMKKMPVKPEYFDEMKRVSSKLSKMLDFVRVDFFDTDEGIKIGELTFFSQCGYGPFTKKEYDFKYGEYFKRTRLYRLISKNEKI